MQPDLDTYLEEKLKSLSAKQRERVLEFVETLNPSRRTLWEQWQVHLKDIPQEELDEMPADASFNLDHYLYGAPKK